MMMGETVHVWQQIVYEKAVYISLNFVVDLKLL